MAAQGLAVVVEVRLRLLVAWVHLRLWGFLELAGGLMCLPCAVLWVVRRRALEKDLVGRGGCRRGRLVGGWRWFVVGGGRIHRVVVVVVVLVVCSR